MWERGGGGGEGEGGGMGVVGCGCVERFEGGRKNESSCDSCQLRRLTCKVEIRSGRPGQGIEAQRYSRPVVGTGGSGGSGTVDQDLRTRYTRRGFGGGWK